MDTTHCIDNNTWERYAANKLEANELAALQKHAASCEICSDIKEGIDAMAQPETLAESVAQLNKQADDYTKLKTKRVPLWYWSAAAVLFISLGLGWYISNTNKKDVAVNTVEKPTTIKENNAETIENGAPKKEVPSINPIDENEPESRVGKPRGRKNSEENNKETATNKAAIPPTDLDDKLLEKNVELSADEAAVLIDTSARGKPTDASLYVDGIAARKTIKKVERTLPSPVSNNLFNNNFNNYSGITNIGFQWSQDSISYTKAVYYLAQDSLKKCIATLKGIAGNKNSIFHERALLLKAKARIQQGKRRKARRLLKQVVALKGALKKEAEKLLKQIQ